MGVLLFYLRGATDELVGAFSMESRCRRVGMYLLVHGGKEIVLVVIHFGCDGILVLMGLFIMSLDKLKLMGEFGEILLQLINESIFVSNYLLNLCNSFDKSVILIMRTFQLPQQLLNLLRLILNRIEVFPLLLFVTVWILVLEIVLTNYLLVLNNFVLQVPGFLLLVLELGLFLLQGF